MMKLASAISLTLVLSLSRTPLPAQGAGRAAAQDASSSKRYDVGELIAPMRPAFPQDSEDWCGMFLPRVLALREALDSRRGEPSKNVVYQFPGPAIDRDRLLDLIVDARFASRDGLSMWRDQLTFEGTQARHDRLRDLLASLSHGLHPRIRVEVSFLEGVALPARVDLEPKAVDALLAAGKRRAVHRTWVRSDLCELIRSGTHANLLLDWDAEVAEKATVYDPKVIRVELGMRLGLVASVLADGRIEILAGLQQSVPQGEFTVKKLLGARQGALHHPRLKSRLLVSRGVIGDGGALVFGGLSKPHGLCVIRCHLERRDANALSGRFQAIPLGDVLQPIPRLPGVRPPRRPGRESPEAEVNQVSADYSLRAAFGSTSNRETNWKLLGNHLLVLGRAGQDTLTRGISKRLQGAVRKRCATRHSMSIELRAGVVDGATVAAHLAGETEVGALANKVPSLGLVATLPGHPFQHVEGEETTYVRDQEVEIAAKSTAANPIIFPAFSGASVTGTLRQGLNGSLSVDGAFYYAVAQLTRLDTGEPAARDIDAMSRDFVLQPIRSVPVRRGQWKLLGLQKNPAGAGSVALLLRVAK